MNSVRVKLNLTGTSRRTEASKLGPSPDREYRESGILERFPTASPAILWRQAVRHSTDRRVRVVLPMRILDEKPPRYPPVNGQENCFRRFVPAAIERYAEGVGLTRLFHLLRRTPCKLVGF